MSHSARRISFEVHEVNQKNNEEESGLNEGLYWWDPSGLRTKEGVRVGWMTAWELGSYMAGFMYTPGHVTFLQAMVALGITLFFSKNTKQIPK